MWTSVHSLCSARVGQSLRKRGPARGPTSRSDFEETRARRGNSAQEPATARSNYLDRCPSHFFVGLVCQTGLDYLPAFTFESRHPALTINP